MPFVIFLLICILLVLYLGIDYVTNQLDKIIKLLEDKR